MRPSHITDAGAVSSLNFCSYNCHGFNTGKTVFISNLLSKCDVLCLQEHWLADSQLPFMGRINSEFLCTGVSGFNNDEILSGRPYGGCAILWRSNLDLKINFVDIPSNRMCGVLCFCDSWKLLVITVYMPYEDDFDNTIAFIEQLSIIDSTIEDYSDAHVYVVILTLILIVIDIILID